MLQMSNLSCIVAGPLGLHAIIPSVIASCKQTYQDVIYPLHDHTDHLTTPINLHCWSKVLQSYSTTTDFIQDTSL